MFDSLSERLSHSLKSITGKAQLTEDNIQETLREVRKALLEADVALEVVKAFVERVKQQAVGQDVSQSLNPGQQFVKIVQDELTAVMGESNESLNLTATPPAVILMAGLQGAGKTTSVAKLARYLQQKEKKKVLVASADVYRPAAIKQLETLASEVNAEFFPSTSEQKPVDIAKNAIDAAKKQFADVVIIDTAGRLHIDETLMGEIKALHKAINPVETLFVIDAMIGQDAVNTAQAFNEALPLTGVILTKADGDARGGAALSVRHITGKPIKFLGVGEKVDALEPFHPDRIASRILGMGDVLSLIEEAEEKLDKKKADKLAKKIKKGKTFNYNDLRDQFQQMQNMGGMGAMLDKLPGVGAGMSEMMQSDETTKQFRRMEAMISSMTPKERRKPDLVANVGSRKKRITAGSGTTIQDLNRLVKQQKQMAKMMKKMKTKKGMANMMRGMDGMLGGGMGGGMPPGLK